MSSLAQQKLIIVELEQATAINRRRLIDSFRTIQPPLQTSLVVTGTALNIAELGRAIKAVVGLFSKGQSPAENPNPFLKVILGTPLLLRFLRRFR